MSTSTTRKPLAEARQIAEEIQRRLEPACQPDRCTIVGSIRRQRPTVGDAEILYVPRRMFRPMEGSLFAEEIPYDPAEEAIEAMLLDGTLKKRENVDNQHTWGPQNKHAVHVASGLAIDLFATDTQRWWMRLVITTGGKETNLALTTSAQRLGMTLHAYGYGFTDRETGDHFAVASERDVFSIAGVPWTEPENRA